MPHLLLDQLTTQLKRCEHAILQFNDRQIKQKCANTLGVIFYISVQDIKDETLDYTDIHMGKILNMAQSSKEMPYGNPYGSIDKY